MSSAVDYPTKYCPTCGASMAGHADRCPVCGRRQPGAVMLVRPEKNRVGAALLAFFFGGFGAHKFYLGKTGKGFLYLAFFWTGVPFIIGFIESIMYLMKSDEEFAADYE